MGDGFGVGVIIGEGPGVGHGVGEGVGIIACNTVHIHVCIAVPFSLDATADTFHVPVTALVFV
ncbi:MAG: hypothetical protein C4B56_04575 [Candidatus Methanophagaceae archaeon]|nr:MAG: hypothetical protein C4B56_04575 [Methanophagales archaeon]